MLKIIVYAAVHCSAVSATIEFIVTVSYSISLHQFCSDNEPTIERHITKKYMVNVLLSEEILTEIVE